jgi:phosphatidylserine/phosphatidylglycerophosphate/cardiolipin synthase-like enzyme
VLVKRVIDGDTVELSTGEKVRLIGVDTPETKDLPKPVQYFGKEVTAFTRQLVEGKPVRLEYDQQRQDKYARTLAYVYLEDGTLVNVEIIRQRHAWAHDKVMILDGETVITGSYNWTVAADEQNGENLLMIRDPRLAKVYTENWRRHAHHSTPYRPMVPWWARIHVGWVYLTRRRPKRVDSATVQDG